MPRWTYAIGAHLSCRGHDIKEEVWCTFQFHETNRAWSTWRRCGLHRCTIQTINSAARTSQVGDSGDDLFCKLFFTASYLESLVTCRGRHSHFSRAGCRWRCMLRCFWLSAGAWNLIFAVVSESLQRGGSCWRYNMVSAMLATFLNLRSIRLTSWLWWVLVEFEGDVYCWHTTRTLIN